MTLLPPHPLKTNRTHANFRKFRKSTSRRSEISRMSASARRDAIRTPRMIVRQVQADWGEYRRQLGRFAQAGFQVRASSRKAPSDHGYLESVSVALSTITVARRDARRIRSRRPVRDNTARDRHRTAMKRDSRPRYCGVGCVVRSSVPASQAGERGRISRTPNTSRRFPRVGRLHHLYDSSPRPPPDHTVTEPAVNSG